MNALELADMLEVTSSTFNDEAAAMLRKQFDGRGVSMHPEWINDFQSFLQYMGEPPQDKMTLERIDNDKGYEPGNLTWADRKTQARNRKCVLLSAELVAAAKEYVANGMTRREVADLMNVSSNVIEKAVRGTTWKS